MIRLLVTLVNCVFLALLFLGLPEATHADVIGYQVSKAPTTQMLVMWGLGTAAAGNMFAALMIIKDRKVRIVVWEWVAVFVGLGLLQYAVYRGYYNFDWLKRDLLWLQRHL